jgi:hypothetical protein
LVRRESLTDKEKQRYHQSQLNLKEKVWKYYFVIIVCKLFQKQRLNEFYHDTDGRKNISFGNKGENDDDAMNDDGNYALQRAFENEVKIMEKDFDLKLKSEKMKMEMAMKVILLFILFFKCNICICIYVYYICLFLFVCFYLFVSICLFLFVCFYLFVSICLCSQNNMKMDS